MANNRPCMAASAQEMLDAVNDAILARLAGRAIDEYTVIGMSLKKTPLADLRHLRDQLASEVSRAGVGTFTFADLRP